MYFIILWKIYLMILIIIFSLIYIIGKKKTFVVSIWSSLFQIFSIPLSNFLNCSLYHRGSFIDYLRQWNSKSSQIYLYEHVLMLSLRFALLVSSWNILCTLGIEILKIVYLAEIYLYSKFCSSCLFLKGVYFLQQSIFLNYNETDAGNDKTVF